MATNHELPPVNSPEEAKQFEAESVKLHAFLDHILAKEHWSSWKRLKDPNEPYAFHEIVLPSYKIRYRSLKKTVAVPVRYEVSSPYIIHDSEDGQAKLDVLVSEHQTTQVGGLLRNPRVDTRRFEFLVEGRHYDYEQPEREPEPLTEESRRYGISDYNFHWRPMVRQPSHRVTFAPNGELVEASIAFNDNPNDSSIFASNRLRYTKEEENLRSGLMAARDINKLLEQAFENPYRREQ